MNKEQRSLSLFQLALRDFKRNRLAVGCSLILIIFYASALFADFLSPYSYDNEERGYSYCPPMKVYWGDDQGKLTWPYVTRLILTFDENHNRVYKTYPKSTYPIKFFSKGDKYKFLGIIPG